MEYTDEMLFNSETLSEKMKRLESETNYKLKAKTPVIIRLDGKAFHTFTKGLDKPFDKDLSYIMQRVALYLAQEIQNVKFVYSQSDEISLLLTDWDNPNTDTWFGYRIQKMTSVTSALATQKFNKSVDEMIEKYWRAMMAKEVSLEDEELYSTKYRIWKSKKYNGLFDCRVFNLNTDEVSNYFLYRYKDARRNAIQALAQSCFSQNELSGISCIDLIDKVKEKINVDFYELSNLQRTGFAVYKVDDKWELDVNVPDIYENRDYVEKWLE